MGWELLATAGGLGEPGWVCALTVFQGEWIAAGGSAAWGGGAVFGCIDRWDGSTWLTLGQNIGASVWSLTVHDGELIAGGEFTTASGVARDHLGRRNGTRWQPLGSGMSGGSSPQVYALTVHHGELIAGGPFTTAGGQVSAHFARWTCTVCPGDLNRDGVVSFDDITPFVLALPNWTEWRYTHTGCP